jgi:protocatechuate 3,4-dioxygenase beta subunit
MEPTRPEPAHEHDLGLHHDLRRLDRRRAIGMLGGAGAGLLLAACGSSSPDAAAPSTSPSSTTASSTTASSSGSSSTAASSTGSSTAGGTECSPIPEETAGPYPGDGSNGPDVLSESGVVRSDIRSSFGSSSGTATGVPLTIRFRVLEIAAGCAPFEGAAVYVWHADADGRYSMYSSGVTDQNYLRGVQSASADGVVEFTSIFPGCYDGRWPHVHFEIYPDLESATDVANKIATSQIALPQDVCEAVYAAGGYDRSAANLAGTSLERDMVFRDGWSRELGTATGSPDAGDLAVTLTVPV